MAHNNGSAAHLSASIRYVGRRLALTFALLAPLGTPLDAWSADHTLATDTPDRLVRATTEALFTAIDDNRVAIDEDPARVYALVENIVMPHVDLPRISRWVLGKEWRRATPPQRERFMGEFRVLLVRSYATAVSQNTDVAITYLPVRLKRGGEDATVSTRIRTRSEQPLDITYRLYQAEAGWRLYDVVVAGVSLVATYRSTFRAEIKRVGIDGLIEQLAAKNSVPVASAPKASP